MSQKHGDQENLTWAELTERITEAKNKVFESREEQPRRDYISAETWEQIKTQKQRTIQITNKEQQGRTEEAGKIREEFAAAKK